MSFVIVMIDKASFSQLEKNSSTSFHQQKNIIKKLLLGKAVNCSECGQPLNIQTQGKQGEPGVKCAKGCTNIALDFV